jgi:hypothetical protein
MPPASDGRRSLIAMLVKVAFDCADWTYLRLISATILIRLWLNTP